MAISYICRLVEELGPSSLSFAINVEDLRMVVQDGGG